MIGFNQDRQRTFMQSFGLDDVDWRDLALWLIILVFITGGLVALFLLMKVYRTRKAPLVAAYDDFCAKVAKAGLVREPHEGPLDFLHRIEHAQPELAARAQPVIDAYVALRYSREQQFSRSADFRALVRKFRIA